MAGYGYSYVIDKGFSAFAHDLSEGAWQAVSTKKYDTPTRKSAQLIEAPRPIAWKLRAMWVIADLDQALSLGSSEALARLDEAWDSAQRALSLTLAAGREHPEPAHRDAAERLQSALLAGSGAEQTTYSYDEEVDFGRHQVAVTSKGALAGDAKKLGLGAYLARVGETTEALAEGLGRAPGQKRAPARSKRMRDALIACSSTFNAIHDEMLFLLDHLPPGPARDHLEALQQPFLALLDRYPPKTSAGEARKPSDGTSPKALSPSPSPSATAS